MTVPSGDVPLRQSEIFRAAQADEGFRSWLAMQEAVMALEFFVTDVPELKRHRYTREGLVVAERELIARYRDRADAYSDENFAVTSRFSYFIGETIRRATEGTWVALPQVKGGALPAVETEFDDGYFNVNRLVQLALVRRSGVALSRVFDHAVKNYEKWVDAGRPPRV